MTPPDAPDTRGLKFIGCKVLHREARYLAAESPEPVDLEFLEKGLHDLQTPDMVARIQAAVDAADATGRYRAILLGYGRCNDGLVGVTARTVPLAIPRAHDCITLFFGSRKRYQAYFDANPGTYYQTTGWIEHADGLDAELAAPPQGVDGVMQQLGLTESYEQLLAKHGKDNADYIIETLGGWAKAYARLCYLEMGTCDEADFIDLARRRAEQKGWAFDRRHGDLTLLRKLFQGPWDHDILVVNPGQTIAPRNDGTILDTD